LECQCRMGRRISSTAASDTGARNRGTAPAAAGDEATEGACRACLCAARLYRDRAGPG
jgi:hypothetical protein